MKTYQQSLFPDRIDEGERESDVRWKLIEPFVPQSGIALDLGSNLGYFGIRMAQSGKDLCVVSLEADPEIAEKQKLIVAANNLDQICILNGSFGSSVSQAWTRTCDWFDLTLALSILHWMDDPAEVVQNLSQMSARMIIELPDYRDLGACGYEQRQLWKDPVKWLSEVTGRDCLHIGRAPRHTSDVASHILLVSGDIDRKPELPYWNCTFEHPLGRSYQQTYTADEFSFHLRGEKVNYVPGVNLSSLMSIGTLVYPERGYWLLQCEKLLSHNPHHMDPAPHNMIWNKAGLTFVDDHDVASGLNSSSALQLFAENIRRWSQGRTTHVDAYVPGLPSWRRTIRESLQFVVRRKAPSCFVSQLGKPKT